jgi:chromosome segregation ATPase
MDEVDELERKLSQVTVEKSSLEEQLEKASQVRFDQALNEAELAREHLKNELDSATKLWDIEREHLLQRHRTANDAVQAKMDEVDELERKLSQVTGERSSLEEQLNSLKSQMEQLKSEAETQRLEAVADAQAAAEIRLQEVRAQARQVEHQEQRPARTNSDSAAITAEISRIVATIGELAEKIESPATDLAAQIRFNRERSELEAYVKGLRFSPGEVAAN